MNFKRNLTVAMYSLAAVLPLTPEIAHAQSYASESRADDSARVDSFGVEPLSRVRPGSELYFTLDGSRGADVTLQIAGAAKAVRLDETRPGHYEGSYTIGSRDRITAASLVTARMTKDGRSVMASLDSSVVSGAPSPAGGATRIAAFTITAPDRVRPGDELTFSMTGTPGAKASVAVRGVQNRIALTEVSRGDYQGSYTVRRQDRPDDSLSATGFLTVNNRETNQQFARQAPLSRDGQREDRADQARAVQQCVNCGVVESVNVVDAKGEGNNVIGTIAGGVLGGVLGHQVGGGTGKDLATIAGAVGGAYAGNRAQNNLGKSKEYQVVVRLDNATRQTFNFAADPAFKVGTRVKVENNAIARL